MHIQYTHTYLSKSVGRFTLVYLSMQNHNVVFHLNLQHYTQLYKKMDIM